MDKVKLSPQEGILLTFMRNKGIGADIRIYDMWLELTAVKMVFEDGNRNMQHYVGAYVSRINRKQDEYEIVPGELKRTYRVQLKTQEK